jgi:SAM-dependent methyltransferase
VTDRAAHWDTVYATKRADEVSWFQAEPTTSLRLLADWAPPPCSVVDVGAGASRLIEYLLAAGWLDVTLLDVSTNALSTVRERLGRRAETVWFDVADVRHWAPGRTFDGWHDRAVFHFLVEQADRDRYCAVATDAVAPGGVVVLGTFASDGPAQCSGLPIARYEAQDLADVFGSSFTLVHAEHEEHETPSGSTQRFCWSVLRHNRH